MYRILLFILCLPLPISSTRAIKGVEDKKEEVEVIDIRKEIMKTREARFLKSFDPVISLEEENYEFVEFIMDKLYVDTIKTNGPVHIKFRFFLGEMYKRGDRDILKLCAEELEDMHYRGIQKEFTTEFIPLIYSYLFMFFFLNIK